MNKTPGYWPARKNSNVTNTTKKNLMNEQPPSLNASQLVDERLEKISKASSTVRRQNSIFSKKRPKSVISNNGSERGTTGAGFILDIIKN